MSFGIFPRLRRAGVVKDSGETMEKPVLILSMAASEEEAARIGKTIVEEKLAACANVVSGVRSLYVWQGNFCDEGEVLLMMKSCRRLVKKVIRRVKALHSYEVPEIIALPIVEGSEDYLKWMEDSLT